MAVDKNPFSVLGFAPSAFQNLGDDDIRSLVKAQHRALSLIHHPDRKSGDSKRFKEVQVAIDKLTEDFEFDFWKKNFLKPRKDQLAEMQKQKNTAEAVTKLFSRGMVDFWLAYCQGRQIINWESSFVLGLSNQEMSGVCGFSIFDPPALSCLMMERIKLSKNRLIEQETGRALPGSMPDVYGTMRYSDGTAKIFDNQFELKISPGGLMSRQNLVKTKLDLNESWRPSVSKEWIELNSRSPAKSYYWNPEGEPVAVQGKLLGSLSKESIANVKSLQQSSPVATAISIGVDLDRLAATETGYAFHEFEPYFRFLRPIVRDTHYVVVVEGTREENLRFKVLGYPRKILLIEE